MKILLDTCTFLWLILDSPRLSARARALCTDPENDTFLSAASAFEIATKQNLGNLELPGPALTYVPFQRERHRILPLPVEETAALHVQRLPKLHRDPFDRLLIAQAIVE
ncbi:MAG: type II toxin-antitoxin system VapC family toxin, partial [Bryobacter sp.]|nr:type II toxin-antitoxin system VapC family toxin [Bryobacter sp.]